MKKSYKGKSKEEKQKEVDALLEQLNEGVLNFNYEPEVYRELLLFQANLPTYSFRNLMLIKAQCEHSSYVASFNQWKEKGRQVRKGQKAIRILAPRFIRVEDEDTKKMKQVLVGFVSVPVFDVSQTEGEPLPFDLTASISGESIEADNIFYWTELLAEADGCGFSLGSTGSSALGFYAPQLHQIVVSDTLSGNNRAKTAVHELVHSRVHHGDAINCTTAEERECVAEGVAFIICSYFGLDTSNYSFSYVKNWTGDGGKSLLKYNTIIQETACKLLTDYESIAKHSSQYDLKGNARDVKNDLRVAQ